MPDLTPEETAFGAQLRTDAPRLTPATSPDRNMARAIELVRFVVEDVGEAEQMLRAIPDDELRPLVTALLGFTGLIWVNFDPERTWLPRMLRDAVEQLRSSR